jgi:hypothetical protein
MSELGFDPNPVLAADAPLSVVDATVLFRGTVPRRRGTAHLAQLDSGRLLLAFTIRRPQAAGMAGALMLTRSDDGGRTWDEPIPMLAYPGWNGYAMGMFRIRDDLIRLSLGRVRVDRSLGGDEPFSGWWTGDAESRDGGDSWTEPGPEIRWFPYWTELYGPSNPHPLADGRLLWLGTGTNGRDEGWQVGVTTTDADGSTYGPVTTVAAAADRNYADPDMERLSDGRFVAVIREMVTRRSVAAVSSDDGATWSPPVPTGFGGSNHNLTVLNSGTLLCAYRDEDPSQYGVSLSVSDDGLSWRFIGRLYRAEPGIRHEPTLYCGYPAIARISRDELLCVLHTYVDDRGHADLHLIRLLDRSQA